MREKMQIEMSAQSLGGQSERSIGSPDRLSTELETLAVMCSAVPEISDDLRALAARVDDLDGRIDEQEGDTSDLQAEIEDLSEAFGQVASNVTSLEETVEEEVTAIQDRQDDFEARLDAVEGCLSSDVLDEQKSHIEAQERSIPFDRGDKFDLVVEEIQGRPDPTLRGKLEKVHTFVDVDDPTEYEEGDVVNVTITDLNGTAAHAVPTETFEE